MYFEINLHYLNIRKFSLSAKKREKKFKKVEFFCLWQGLEGLAQDSSEAKAEEWSESVTLKSLVFDCLSKVEASKKPPGL
ncbi:MAG: hypothetical protein SPK10_08190 [Treponema sp.]|nr:hypothetical protein [Treponema sp.]